MPEGNLLGPRGAGFKQFLEILDGGRISVAAMGLGLAQGAYDLARAYAAEREQFGKPIARSRRCSSPSPTWPRSSRPRAGSSTRPPGSATRAGSSPRTRRSRSSTPASSKRVADKALQLHGGYGFMDEYAISRLYRDQKVLEIGEGTNEVQRMVIARHLGL